MSYRLKKPLAAAVDEEDRSSALVLSGGGARGAFQVGVWEVLRHDTCGLRRTPDVISGTSAGAINGSLIAAGLSPDAMMEFWLDIAKDPPVEASETLFRSLRTQALRVLALEARRPLRRRLRGLRILASSLRRHRPWRASGLLALLLEHALLARYDNFSDVLDGIATASVFSTARLRGRLERALGGSIVPPDKVALAINTVDVRTGQVVRFVNRQPSSPIAADETHYRIHRAITVEMIAASAAIPVLFDPVTVDGIELWDGGLLVNTALAPAIALGARRIIPVLVNAGRDGSPHRPMHLGTAIERLADAFLENAYNTDRKLAILGNELAEHLPEMGFMAVDLYEPIRPLTSKIFNAGSYLYFERDALLKMYEAGRQAARQWLVRGPRLDAARGPLSSAVPTATAAAAND